jgi:hypothetical protein
MSDAIYKKIKKQNGEKFAQTIRNHHNGLMEIEELPQILRYAGRDPDDVAGLLPYLMTLLNAEERELFNKPKDPFELLDKAGYDAFHADTLEKQNSITHYYEPDELLCTFNDAARYEDYHIVHAVKKDADQIQRKHFKGKEERQDEYGTSVISIQMLKDGGEISIKNRYNHTVPYCDNTFSSNPDHIIDGLSSALQSHFNVTFNAPKNPLPEGFNLVRGHIIKYNMEHENIYYGDQFWTRGGKIYTVDRGRGDAMFDDLLFDNKTKTLRKIDKKTNGKFHEDFNETYGGNRGLAVDKDGNLRLNGDILIGAQNAQIITLNLPGLLTMRHDSLIGAPKLKEFRAPDLIEMGKWCLYEVPQLEFFDAPVLTHMDNHCLHTCGSLTKINIPMLQEMKHHCLNSCDQLKRLHAPSLVHMGESCLKTAYSLVKIDIPMLETIDSNSLCWAPKLRKFHAPRLIRMVGNNLNTADLLEEFNAKSLVRLGSQSLQSANSLKKFHAHSLEILGNRCLNSVENLKIFFAPQMYKVGSHCLSNAPHIKARFNPHPALRQVCR